MRYGDYVAKLSFAPNSGNLKALTGQSVDLDADYNALQQLVHKFFRYEDAVWEVRAQLALVEDGEIAEKDKHFPIEKADTPWPEDRSPWQTVAHITVRKQESYSDARQLFVDEQLSFSPWHALAAHQLLGGIMRSRLKAYEEARKYRAQRNAREIVEPESIDEVPA